MATSETATAVKSRRSNLKAERIRSSWIFLAPMLLVLAFVAGWPLLKTIWFGFTDASLNDIDGAEWVGFRNYLEWLDYGNGEGEWLGLLADDHAGAARTLAGVLAPT